MLDGREYILERAKGKTTSIAEFNYDQLQAPPIAMMFTPSDISELNSIAKSIRWSARPDIKYKKIDEVMNRRGFVKFVAGTNRIAYRPINNNDFLVKVAYDNVGLGDNPKEFQNQFIFKPFVTKVFEVTPCGTLGVFERVNPITSREEFLSVASDIYEVINEWFIGEYILEDIGTKFFMNWGIRKNFGPVLLDYPYVYKLDGKKLYCNVPSETEISGCCGGEIDYDPGFNFLYCKKCGVRYRANELAEAIQVKKILSKGDSRKMRVRLSGGTKNFNNVAREVVEEVETKKEVASVSTKNLEATEAKTISVNLKDLQANKNKEEARKKKASSDSAKSRVTIIRPTKATVIPPVKEEEKPVVEEEAKSDDKATSKPICPISFVEEATTTVTDQRVKFQEEKVVDPKEEILKAIDTIVNNTKTVKTSTGYFLSIIDNLVKRLPDRFIAEIVKCLLKNEIIKIESSDPVISNYTDDGENSILVSRNISIKFANTDESLYESDEDGFLINPSDIVDSLRECGYYFYEDGNEAVEDVEEEEEEESSEDVVVKTDFFDWEAPEKYVYPSKFLSGKIINLKDIFGGKTPSRKAIVMLDDEGCYKCNINGEIIAIDILDSRLIDNLSVVSKDWLDKTQVLLGNSLKEIKEAPVGFNQSNTNNNVDEEATNDEGDSEKVLEDIKDTIS